MADISSEQPIRSQLPGQVNYDDVIVKVGDATNPTTQQLAVDSSGKVTAKMDDAAGNGLTSTTVSTHQALDVNVVASVAGSGDNTPATQNITAQDTSSVSTAQANGQLAITGTPTAGSAASFAFGGYDTVEVQITGTWTGTLATEVSMDGGTTWFARGIKQTGTAYFSTTFTANAEGGMNYGGMTNFRVRSTAAWTGTATIRIVLSTNVSSIIVSNPLLLRDATVQSIANTIKAASTAAQAADTALVTAFSPNSPLPTGSNTIGAIANFPNPVDVNYGTVGASTIRTASEIGNATGAANFNYGAVGAQTLRTASQIGNATGAADFNFGAASAQTIRAAALLGNAAGLIDYNYGAASAQTIRTASQVGNATGAADFNFGTVGAQTLRSAAQIGNATGAADFNFGSASVQTLRVAALPGNATGIADFNNGATGAQTPRVAANLAVAGANVSATNPVPVQLSSAPLGTPVNDYKAVTALAVAGTDNHDYTITSGKTFQGKKIWASSSAALKAEVQVSPDGSSFSTLWVGFNSASNPNVTIDMDEMVFLESGTGSKIRIIITNEDKKAADFYSTISGTEVP